MFKSAILAAVAVVGIGAAAEAAIVHYGLTYEGTTFTRATVWNKQTNEVVHEGDLFYLDNTEYGLPLGSPAFRSDKEVHFRTVFENNMMVSCGLGTFDCHHGNYPYWSSHSFNPLTISDEYFWLAFSGGVYGSTVQLTEIGSPVGLWFGSADYTVFAGSRTSHFTITNLAPVPLPAGAFMLPAALAGFGMLRRRRKALG